MLQMPRTDSQTLKDSATQLLTKYKSGALVTQLTINVSTGKEVCWVEQSTTGNTCQYLLVIVDLDFNILY